MDGKSGHEQGSEEEPPRLPTAPPAQASRVRETEAMKATAANCLPLRRGPGLRAAHLASGSLPDAGKGPWLCGPYFLICKVLRRANSLDHGRIMMCVEN